MRNREQIGDRLQMERKSRNLLQKDLITSNSIVESQYIISRFEKGKNIDLANITELAEIYSTNSLDLLLEKKDIIKICPKDEVSMKILDTLTDMSYYEKKSFAKYICSLKENVWRQKLIHPELLQDIKFNMPVRTYEDIGTLLKNTRKNETNGIKMVDIRSALTDMQDIGIEIERKRLCNYEKGKNLSLLLDILPKLASAYNIDCIELIYDTDDGDKVRYESIDIKILEEINSMGDGKKKEVLLLLEYICDTYHIEHSV